MTMKWYVIQAYSGYENRVRESLLERFKQGAWSVTSARS